MGPIHALIIDDDHDTADLFRTVLGLIGYECHSVYSAKAALAYLATNLPDIVLLDLRLGLEISGSDILYQIRSNPRFDKVRVIVITSYPSMIDQIDSLADLTLVKPIEVEDLKKMASRLTQLRPKTYLFRDPVTNLYTLSFFLTRVEHAYERTRRHPELISVLAAIDFSFDLSNAPQYIGKENIPLLMKPIVDRLRSNFRPTDTFGALEHQRVGALYEDLVDKADIPVIIGRVKELFREEISLRGGIFRVTPRFGVVRIQPDIPTPEKILNLALEALEEARSKERDVVFSDVR